MKVFPAVCLLLCVGCGSDRGDHRGQPQSEISGEWFIDDSEKAGLDFVHFNGMTGRFYPPESMAPGVALLDYDNDGDLDVFLVQGHVLGGHTHGDLPLLAREPMSPGGRLFRNDLKVAADGTRTLHFTDATARSGIDARGYGMGVAAGDFNNDGCVDVYLTNFGPNHLFRNNCNGSFTDVSKQSGTADPAWSVSASFVDYDRDGWLDLFVANYLDYAVENDHPCPSRTGERDYCDPSAYRPTQSRLFHNDRNGRFSDVTASALVGGDFGPALGIATADFNGDGWIDMYVANDGQPNQLWINQHDGTFTNTALAAGAAVNGAGRATASMGVDAGDFDEDGDEDLFFTNLTQEMSTLFVNAGSGVFEDGGQNSGVALSSRRYTGFGTGWFDFDNDGWLDILSVNGAVRRLEALVRARDPFPFHQKKLLLRNVGQGRFEDVTDRAGTVFQLSEVGRGAAFGDVDNDGDMDVLVGNDAGHVRLLVNNIGNSNHWVGVRVVGKSTPRPSNGSARPERVQGRDMLGARIAVVADDGRTRWRRARADGSYASANDPRVLVGLGRSTRVRTVRVTWPGGVTEEWTAVMVDRWTTLEEGTGR